MSRPTGGAAGGAAGGGAAGGDVACAAVPVVAVVTRSGLIESRHHGHVVGLSGDGALALDIGETHGAVFGRSSNKPLQALAMVEAGLDLPSELLALVIASHSGQPMHLDRVRAILARYGLREAQLDNTADLPLDVDAARHIIAAGGSPSPLLQNCSGKHAGMLATCVVNGWPTDGYLDPSHPLQVAIGAAVARVAGEPVALVGVDGCGAPAHALSLLGLARAFRAIALGTPGSAEHAVATAIRRHPDLVGGRGRDVTRFVQAMPTLIAKDGAEGVYAAATDDGRAVALKIDDGAWRARPAVLVQAFDALGIEMSDEFRAVADVAILGHGKPVGDVRAVPFAP